MNIERHVQQRSMLAPWSGDGRISGSAPGSRRASSIGARWRPCSAALLGAQPAVVAFADGLRSTVVSEKMICSPLPSGPPSQPVWKRPRLNGRVPLKQSFSRSAERGRRRASASASPGRDRRVRSARPPSA